MPGSIAAVGAVQQFYVPDAAPERHLIPGVTRDAGGNPLGNCVVECFQTSTNTLIDRTVSDANGNFTISATTAPYGGLTYFLVAYKPGSPDVAGTTVNTLTGTP
jgi:hypothetical protein